MSFRKGLAVLAIFVSLFGCRSESDQTIPDELIGVWKTAAPGYENNYLELRKAEILFDAGLANSTVNSIFNVETVRQADGKTSLLTIDYSDADGNDYETSFYYDQNDGGSIRFKNQMKIEWKLFQRRIAEQQGLSQSRPARHLGRHSNWNIALALFGMALVFGASIWRLRHSSLEVSKRAQGDQAVSVFAWAAQRWREAEVPLQGSSLRTPAEGLQAEPTKQIGDDSGSGKTMFAGEGTDWSQAPTSVPAIVGREQRRSERILLKIPVLVTGTDEEGNAFEERAFTLSINRDGAFICLRNSPRQGDSVMITNLGTRQSCPFRLCESGQDSSGEVTAWGIECLDRSSDFWQIRFPENPPAPSSQRKIVALLKCEICYSREVAELSVLQYRDMLENGSMKRDCSNCEIATEWDFVLVEAATESSPEETSAVSLPSGEENRLHKRIIAKLPIRLRHPKDGRVESTLTENVSKSGVCCAGSMELNVDDVILLTFESGAGLSEEDVPARIMWCRTISEKQKNLYGIRFERQESRTT